MCSQDLTSGCIDVVCPNCVLAAVLAKMRLLVFLSCSHVLPPAHVWCVLQVLGLLKHGQLEVHTRSGKPYK